MTASHQIPQSPDDLVGKRTRIERATEAMVAAAQGKVLDGAAQAARSYADELLAQVPNVSVREALDGFARVLEGASAQRLRDAVAFQEQNIMVAQLRFEPHPNYDADQIRKAREIAARRGIQSAFPTVEHASMTLINGWNVSVVRGLLGYSPFDDWEAQAARGDVVEEPQGFSSVDALEAWLREMARRKD